MQEANLLMITKHSHHPSDPPNYTVENLDTRHTHFLIFIF